MKSTESLPKAHNHMHTVSCHENFSFYDQTRSVKSAPNESRLQYIQFCLTSQFSPVLLHVKHSVQMQYSYNTTAIQEFFLVLQLYCTCEDPAIQCCNTSFLQLAENLQATCSSCKKLVLQLYCACADCCNTTK